VLARRLLIALVVLMALTALVSALSPTESPMQDGPPAADSSPAPPPVEETLDAQQEGQRVRAEVGQIVRIMVRSAELESVSLAEVGTETAEPDSPARFELLAEIPGTYAIETLESGRRIGELEIVG
jgi:hypothetical protein